jgi:hypothetical protein
MRGSEWLQREIMLGISDDEATQDHLQAMGQALKLIANCLDAQASCSCL